MIKTVGQGANIRNLSQGILNELTIPLPPLATQKAIVAEIEAEQALVAAKIARSVQVTNVAGAGGSVGGTATLELNG